MSKLLLRQQNQSKTTDFLFPESDSEYKLNELICGSVDAGEVLNLLVICWDHETWSLPGRWSEQGFAWEQVFQYYTSHLFVITEKLSRAWPAQDKGGFPSGELNHPGEEDGGKGERWIQWQEQGEAKGTEWGWTTHPFPLHERAVPRGAASISREERHCVGKKGVLTIEEEGFTLKPFRNLGCSSTFWGDTLLMTKLTITTVIVLGPGAVSQVNLEAKNKFPLVSGEQSLC